MKTADVSVNFLKLTQTQNKMQRSILSIALLAVAHGLPQIQQTEKDLVDVENFLEQQLPGIIQGPVHDTIAPTVEHAQGIFDALLENVTTEYANSSIPAIITTVSETVTDAVVNPESPFHFIINYLPQFILDRLPVQARTGALGAFTAIVILTVAAFAFLPVTYYIGFFVGKYVLGSFIFPNSVEEMAEEAAKAGRALIGDTDALDNLHNGVMKAVDTYNLLQQFSGQYQYQY